MIMTGMAGYMLGSGSSGSGTGAGGATGGVAEGTGGGTGEGGIGGEQRERNLSTASRLLTARHSKHYVHSHKALRSIVCINKLGVVSVLSLDRASLIAETAVPARDLRLLDPRSQSPASILIRERALVLVLENLRAIITHDRIMLVTRERVPRKKLPPSSNTSASPSIFENIDDVHVLTYMKALHDRLTRNSAPGTPTYGGGGASLFKHDGGSDGSRAGSRFGSSNNLADLAWDQRHSGSGCGGDIGNGKKDYIDQTATTTQDIRLEYARDGTGLLAEPDERHYESALDEMPFEFIVLEVALEVTCNTLENETCELEQEGKRAVDSLARKVTTSRLEKVRRDKGRISRLLTRVKQVKEELGHLLDDDDDMRQMYLTRKYEQQQRLASTVGTPFPHVSEGGVLDRGEKDDEHSKVSSKEPETPLQDGAGGSMTTMAPQTSSVPRSHGRRIRGSAMDGISSSLQSGGGGGGCSALTAATLDAQEIEDFDMLEDMLEVFHEAISGITARLTSLDEYVEDGEAFTALSQDNLRNQIISFDLALTMMTLCITVYSCMASIFGMNLTSGLERDGTSFVAVVVIGLLVSLALLVSMTWYLRAVLPR